LSTAQDGLNTEKLTNAQKKLQLEKNFASKKDKLLAQGGFKKSNLEIVPHSLTFL